MNRQQFFKNSCISAACLCGFGGIALSSGANSNKNSVSFDEGNLNLVQDWISNLLANIGDKIDTKSLRTALKQCANVHYEHLNMDEMLSGYIGRLADFLEFISEKWGWKVDYDKETQTIVADENKNYCVCPLINREKGIKSAAICYCSEGFAEHMFSKVAGKPVKATVISSIQRGDKSCKYLIKIS